jgi:YidC/Oxa1 family membrane protein insertase
MMDANRKRTVILAVIFAAIGLAYVAFTKFFGPEETPEQAARERPAAPAQQAEGDDREARMAARRERRSEASVRGERFEATIDNLAGGLMNFRLIGDHRFEDEGRPLNLVTSGPGASPQAPERFAPFHVEFARLGLPEDLVWEIEQVSEREVRLRWEGEGLRITRTFRAGRGPYQLWQTVRLENLRNRPVTTRLEVGVARYVTREQESGGSFSFIPGQRSREITHGTCVYDDETERKDRDSLAPEDEAVVPHGYGARNVDVAAVESAYFVLAAAAHRERAARCGLYGENFRAGGELHGTAFESRLIHRWDTIAAGQSRTWQTLGYVGPKDRPSLETAGHKLSEVVDLGFFALIAGQLANLLGFIHGVLPEPIRNWGLAIILLTILVRLALFPLTNLSFSSMSRMRQLKPEIDRINELYKENPERKGAAVMELYRKHKINPLSGCLPMLAQLPIWWALYTSLSTNIELYHMPFVGWWQDLSGPDPYFVLPLALGALMHVQQRITPSTMDPAQAKMMMWMMPIMITVFMLFLPAGLCLYMLTNSALGIGQQKLNEWRMSRQPAIASEPSKTAETPSASGDDDDGDDEGPETGEGDTTTSGPTTRRPKRKRLKGTRRGRA